MVDEFKEGSLYSSGFTNRLIIKKNFSEELKRAQKIRRNRLEYDALSKVIKEFPDRQTTETRLAEIEAELEKSRQEEEALDEKLLQRKKQFHLLIHTIHQVGKTDFFYMEYFHFIQIDDKKLMIPVIDVL